MSRSTSLALAALGTLITTRAAHAQSAPSHEAYVGHAAATALAYVEAPADEPIVLGIAPGDGARASYTCEAPCLFHAAPGAYTLEAGREHGPRTRASLVVPAEGTRVSVRLATSHAPGVALVAVGGAGLAFAIAYAVLPFLGCPFGRCVPERIEELTPALVGAALGGSAAIGLIVGGAVLYAWEGGGLSRPRAPRVALVPLRDGASVVGSLAF